MEALLKKILTEHLVKSQQQLLEVLKSEGQLISQATLSRWLKLCGVKKQRGGYVWPVAEFQPMVHVQPMTPIENEILLAPPNLLVIKTAPGNASAIAARIDAAIKQPDQIGFERIVGTIAGDDTVFLATSSGYLLRVKEAISSLF